MPERYKDKSKIELSKPKVKKAGKLALKGAVIAAKASHKIYKTAQLKAREIDDVRGISLEAAQRKRERERQDRIAEDNKPENVEAREKAFESDEKRRMEEISRTFAEINRGSTFSISNYAQERKTKEPWTTVEIGPRRNPVGLNRSYRSGSSYIGVEVHSPDRYDSSAKNKAKTERAFGEIRDERPNENISLLSGSTAEIPDGVADELFAVYVYDDPHTNRKDVTREAYRMLKPGGHFIVQDHGWHLHNWLKDGLEHEGFELQYAREWKLDHSTPLIEEENTNYWHDYMDEIEILGLSTFRSNLDLFIAMKPKDTTSID